MYNLETGDAYFRRLHQNVRVPELNLEACFIIYGDWYVLNTHLLILLLKGVSLEEDTYEVGARMTVDRAVKKYREMYVQLLDHGFTQSQIEPAMEALPLVS